MISKTIPGYEIVTLKDLSPKCVQRDADLINIIISHQIHENPTTPIQDIVDHTLSEYIPEYERNDPAKNLAGYYKALRKREMEANNFSQEDNGGA